MNIIFVLALILLITGVIFLVKPKMEDLESLHNKVRKNKTLKEVATQKKVGKLRRLFVDADTMMMVTGQGGMYRLVFLCLISTIAGALIGVIFNNFILVPVFAVVGFAIPFFLIRVHYINYNQLILDELEPTLSLITTSYERNNNILQSFEENLPYVQEPLKPIFEEFVFRVKHINPNITEAIEDMKDKVNHSVFVEWCDALKNCASDHTLKYTLSPIVAKLTEIKVVNGELKNILFASLRTFYVMLALTGALTVISLFIFPSFLEVELPEFVKSLVLAVDIAVMSFSTMKVYLETKSINSDI